MIDYERAKRFEGPKLKAALTRARKPKRREALRCGARSLQSCHRKAWDA
jgi:hypothetical protein